MSTELSRDERNREDIPLPEKLMVDLDHIVALRKTIGKDRVRELTY